MAQYDGQQVAFAQGRYRIERFWGCLPEDRQLGIISTLAVGSDGTLFVAQRNGPPVLVFAPDGQLRDIWPEHTAADPHGISVARTETSGPDRILLVDRDAHQVLLCSTQGEVLLALGERHRPRFQAPFNHPTSAAQAADGDIYVADGYGNTVVHRFDSGGRLLSTWGCPGDGPGAFTTPHAIWLDGRDRVLVADRENNRVQLFDREGVYLESWRGFYKPLAIAEDGQGRIYVSDQIPRVSQLSPEGELIGLARPAWNVPHGMACGPDDEIFVTEMAPNSLTRLSPMRDCPTSTHSPLRPALPDAS